MSRLTSAFALLGLLSGCGPSFPFLPSNISRDEVVSPGEDLLFDEDHCGPVAIINTDTREISCHRPGIFSPSFAYELRYLPQASGPELAIVVGRNVRIGEGTEVQLKGPRPVVLAALDTLEVRGSITARDPILKYQGQAGGASEPQGSNSAGAGQGGGQIAEPGTGAGGGSYCGSGGHGGDDTDPVRVGAAGGATYGSQDLTPLLAGSSGGRNGNHSGAGGGAVHLIAGNRISIAGTGVVNMGGRGGGWFGNGGGSGGAILLEAPEVEVAGTLAANGGGGGGGPSGGGEDGADADGTGNAAAGGAGNAGGGDGGDGSAGGNLDGAAGENGTTGGGGGGGAGRIRINTFEDGFTLGGTLSPQLGACATQGALQTDG